jgi:hypothetical protein
MEEVKKGWAIKKEVSVGHIVTTLSIVAAGVSYIITNEKQHAVNSSRLDSLQAIVMDLKGADVRQEVKMEGAVARIEAQIQRLDDKLDRILKR